MNMLRMTGVSPSEFDRALSRARESLHRLVPEILAEPRRDENRAPTGVVDLTRSEEVYRRLTIKHHPDRGGQTSAMQDINELWQAVKADLKLR